MKRLTLKVDSKGRVQIPKVVREKLGIGGIVSATIEGGVITLETPDRILDRVSNSVRFNFESVVESMPTLRKAAAEELFKRIP